MTAFAPIAIVGRSCLLPGAANAAQLWMQVTSGRDLLTDIDMEPLGMSPTAFERLRQGYARNGLAHMRAGIVQGFDRLFQPGRYGKYGALLRSLDASFQWTVWTAHQALKDASLEMGWPQKRAGLVLGNVGLPTPHMAKFARAVWFDAEPSSPGQDRFCFGSPAHIAATVLQLGLGGYAVDAACASSLYAIKLACDRLHDGEADLMLAGGINGADVPFAYETLAASDVLSPTGQSRPFHADADGLVPSHGAAMVALKRLEDALHSGDRIHGVIRGIGLCSSGRPDNQRSSDESGPLRAMRAACEVGRLHSSDIGLLECHSAGTKAADAAELDSIRQLFGDGQELVLTSLKSNVGHLLGASGAAGLIKLTEALTRRMLPPTRITGPLLPQLRETRCEIPDKSQPWKPSLPLRAAISAFGSGGNHAHLILEPPPERTAPCEKSFPSTSKRKQDPLAVVGIGILAGRSVGVAEFVRDCLGPAPDEQSENLGRADQILLSPEVTCHSPHRWQEAVPQSSMLLAAAQQAMRDAGHLSGLTAGVFAGMEIDPEMARLDARRLQELLAAQGTRSSDSSRWDMANATALSDMRPAHSPGHAPNSAANRLSSQFDLSGPSLAIGSGEDSGSMACSLAARELRMGTIDFALVGAVDLSCHPVQERALQSLAPHATGNRTKPGPTRVADAAVVLVLERLADAQKRNARIHAVLPGEEMPRGSLSAAPDRVSEVYGESYAAKGLLNLTAAILAAEYGCGIPRRSGIMRPWLPGPSARGFEVDAGATCSGRRTRIQVLPPPGRERGLFLGLAPSLVCYSGRGRREVMESLRADRRSTNGPTKLAMVFTGSDEYERLREHGLRWLSEDTPAENLPAGCFYAASPVRGEVAFVYTWAAAAYHGMGDRLLAAIPELAARLRRRVRDLNSLGGWVYDRSSDTQPSLDEQLRGASMLAQIHTELSTGLLGIRPDAVIGLSSGESNALFAMGAWQEMEPVIEELIASGYCDRETAGRLECARRSWGLEPEEEVRWINVRVLCPVARVREALAGEPRTHLLIVHTDEDCLIGGEEEACRRVLRNMDSPPAFEMPGHIAHCPEMAEFAETWRRLHTRPTIHPAGVRFYTNALGDSYALTDQSVAENLLAQAVATVDFPRTIRKAYQDGVRIFIEHGPRSSCTGWIAKILGDLPHVAVALDQAGRSSVDQAASAVAQLVAHGVACDHKTFFQHLQDACLPPAPQPVGPQMSVSAHPAPAEIREVALHQAAAAVQSDVEATETKMASIATPSPGPDAPILCEPFTRMKPAPVLPIWQENPSVAAGGNGGRQPAIPQEPQTVSPAPVSISQSIALLHRRSLDAQIRAMSSSIESFLGLHARAGSVPATSSRNGNLRAPATPAPLPVAPETPAAAAIEKPAEVAASELFEPNSLTSRGFQSSPAAHHPSGPRFSRAQLETHARGRLSSLFGSAFESQDASPLRVRMPHGPLLLVDRVTGIDVAAGVPGRGTVWTQTDVREDSWYLEDRRVPLGILMEAGHAHLFLFSYLGMDAFRSGMRRYRLLGGNLTVFGPLPTVGETLTFEIRGEGVRVAEGAQVFRFSLDCRVGGELRLTIRGGLSAVLHEEEIAKPRAILWEAAKEPLPPGLRLDNPARPPARSYTPEQVCAFRSGDGLACFGTGYERLAAQTLPPSIGKGRLDLFDEVLQLDPRGGPWKRGFMRAAKHIRGKEWFFEGHYRNDPCVAESLMMETAQQLLSFYLTALGFSLNQDGWRFEPVQRCSIKFQYRAQATPANRQILYEVYIREVDGGPLPAVFADVLGIIDGRKGFLARNIGVALVPDTPKDRLPVPKGCEPDFRPAAIVSGRRVDPGWIYHSTLGRSGWIAKWGERFDGPMRTPRLPNPPYLFFSRVTRIDAVESSFKLPAQILSEYDIPADGWYFQGPQRNRMPLCVLLEAGLQPCGWLSNFYGSSGLEQVEIFYRNLDGAIELLAPVTPADEVLEVQVKAASISRMGDMSIQAFDVTASVSGRAVLKMNATFGFFTETALAEQVGIVPSSSDLEFLNRAANVDSSLKSSSTAEVRPGGLLDMLDRISGFWPDDGRAGLGVLRGEKEVDPREWFFKTHFYRDPVMPGSLGIHCAVQLVEFFLQRSGLGDGLVCPFFQVVAGSRPLRWKYRGQITPERKRVVVVAEITSVDRETNAVIATADASLWVDDVCVYKIESLAVQMTTESASPLSAHRTVIEFSPEKDPWVLDHCPNLVTPVMPIMTAADLMASAAAEADRSRVVSALRDIAIHRWITLDRPKGFRVLTHPAKNSHGEHQMVRLLKGSIEEAANDRPPDHAWDTVANCIIETSRTYPEPPSPFPPLPNAHPEPLVYETLEGFHGPAFHLMRSVLHGDMGATSTLDVAGGSVPMGLIHPALLDCAYHSVPLHGLHAWLPAIEPDQVALPRRIDFLCFYGEAPRSGTVVCEVRLRGFEQGSKLIVMDVQYVVDGRVWAEGKLVNMLVNASLLTSCPGPSRWTYLRQRKFDPDIALSEPRGRSSVLSYRTMSTVDWIPGSVARLYGIEGDRTTIAHSAVRKEHVARTAQVHPASIAISEDLTTATPENQPYTQYHLKSRTESLDIHVADSRPPSIALQPAADYWREQTNAAPAPEEQRFFASLCEAFLDGVNLLDVSALRALRQVPIVYLGDPVSWLEQIVMAALLPPLTGTPLRLVTTRAPEGAFRHALQAALGAWTGDQNPLANFLVFPDNPAGEAFRKALESILEEERLSMLLPWSSWPGSSASLPDTSAEILIEVAARAGAAVVPIRSTSPSSGPASAWSPEPELPQGLSRFQIWLGKPVPLAPQEAHNCTQAVARVRQSQAELAAMALRAAKANPGFVSRVQQRMSLQGLPQEIAVLLECHLPD